MISERIEFDYFAWIHLILEPKFKGKPINYCKSLYNYSKYLHWMMKFGYILTKLPCVYILVFCMWYKLRWYNKAYIHLKKTILNITSHILSNIKTLKKKKDLLTNITSKNASNWIKYFLKHNFWFSVIVCL